MTTSSSLADMFYKNQKKIALYVRLSHEDGDKNESLSIANQRMKLKDYTEQNFSAPYAFYIDDGYTGTNFDRPGFQQLLCDIENNQVLCVIVKDLSRLGRNMAKAGAYIQEYFPSKKIRFIAIDDHIDKNFNDLDTSKDMIIDLKNMFNGFYPKDISKKVRSSLRTKQTNGQFIGAFACYGYKKAPDNHNQLIVDEPAARIVTMIFHLYLAGYGQNTIAKLLNQKQIPCPSEYKKLCGLHYQNGNRLQSTTYWTYSSIRNILRNQIYTGNMVQNCTFRQICSKKAISLPENEWIIVPNTHEAIIPDDTFEKVQELLKRNTRQITLQEHVHLFAGYLKCGDCGRAMIKRTRHNTTYFCCGSYQRYGTSRCSSHYITQNELEQVIRNDFNTLLKSLPCLEKIIYDEQKKSSCQNTPQNQNILQLNNTIQKLQHKKERAYDDYTDHILSKQEYLSYKKKYEDQITSLHNQINLLAHPSSNNSSFTPWIETLINKSGIQSLDRETVIELIDQIYIYSKNTIKIIYNFSSE